MEAGDLSNESRFERLRSSLKFAPIEVAVLAGLGLLVVGGASLAWVRSRPVPLTLAAPAATTEESAAAVAPATIWVHVVGAVRRAGVYELSGTARGIDAVRAAGGLGPHADVTAVNLARTLTDGEQLVIPRRSPAAASAQGGGDGPSETAGALVNVNTAGSAELESLPGIGPALAERIIQHREQHGPFTSIRDLLDVSGIGEKTLANLEPYITV